MFPIVALTASVSNGGPVLAGHATGIQLLATRGGLGHAAAISVTLLDQAAEGLVEFAPVLAALGLGLAQKVAEALARARTGGRVRGA